MLLAKLIKPWVAALLAVEVAVEARAAYELAALNAKELALVYANVLSIFDPTPVFSAFKYMFAILL